MIEPYYLPLTTMGSDIADLSMSSNLTEFSVEQETVELDLTWI